MAAALATSLHDHPGVEIIARDRAGTFAEGAAQDAQRDAEKITARMQHLVPHLTATSIPEAGHALVSARISLLPFLATSLLQPGK